MLTAESTVSFEKFINSPLNFFFVKNYLPDIRLGKVQPYPILNRVLSGTP